MISYTIFKPSGQIYYSGNAESQSDITRLLEGDLLVLYAESLPNQYVQDGAVVDIPPAPGSGYTFDYDTKAWVFDTAAATAAAMSQIDTLLADGPDRISPLWWAAMSEGTQALWTQYRLDLLNVPNQTDFPKTIVWPIKPTASI